jgi:hypothetical protein
MTEKVFSVLKSCEAEKELNVIAIATPGSINRFFIQ